MFAITSNSYSIVSVTVNDAKIQNDLSYNIFHLSFNGKLKYSEGNAVNIEALAYHDC